MDATAFRNVIGNYNTKTMVFILIFLVVGFTKYYPRKVKYGLVLLKNELKSRNE